jgi:hypothetical protein
MNYMASVGAAYLTLKRARKDLANLTGVVTLLQRGEHHDFVVASQKPTGGVEHRFASPLPDLSVDVGVITGQLRAALDQLVYALFELRKGHPPPLKRRTQFPICETPQHFKSRIEPDLEGLDAADIALIEKSQPYNGRQWLRELKLLAEEHKHRRLIFLKAIGGAQHFMQAAAKTEYLSLPSGGRVAKTIHVNTHIAGPIVFADGTPAIHKLQILEAEVVSVVDAFKPRFN